MSRIGRLPIAIPAGVDIKIDASNTVIVKGKNGTLTKEFHKDMIIKLEDGILTVQRPSEQKMFKSLHGLTRTLINNMVEGVTNGFTKGLDINGVGYRAAKQGKKLVLTLGYSHPVEMEEPEGITVDVPAPNKIIVKGIDKQAVGEFAAKIRIKRKPEPYKGKGIKYENEVIRRKEGKTGGKGKK
jgi:large subunit ribosomal protein L6